MRPDAIRWPRASSSAGTSMLLQRDEDKNEIVSLAEQHLQCGPLELARVRAQVGEFFATRDIRDELLYPNGKPRYRWEKQSGGISYGYLINGQKAD